MYISQLNSERLDIPTVNKLIFNLKDDHVPGDVIFVFGSPNAVKYRVPKAVELYKHNRAKYLLLSGGQSVIPEARMMKKAAIYSGVKERDIMIEINSTNTKENVVFSKSILDRKIGLKNIKRIILVSSLYHLRRCLLTMKTFMPSWIEYSLCGVYGKNTRPDNWHTNVKGRTRVMNEVKKLIKYTRNKELLDSLF